MQVDANVRKGASPPQDSNRPDWLTSKIAAQVVTIWPDQAAWILANCFERNRKIRVGRIEQWSSQLRDGKWSLNGESIKFDSNCKLVDGHHRLHACVETGIGITTVVMTGTDPVRSRQTVDIGMPRTMGDMLSMSGSRNGILVASTVRALHLLWSKGASRNPPDVFNPEALTRDVEYIQSIADAFEQEIEMACEATKGLPKRWGQLGSVAALWMEFWRASSVSHASEFWDAIITGAGLDQNDARLALRNRLQADSTVPEVANEKRRINRQDLRNRTIIRTWNRWIRGDTAIIRSGVPVLQVAKSDTNSSNPYPVIESPA